MHVLFILAVDDVYAILLACSLYTFPAERSQARQFRKRKFAEILGIHFMAPLAPPKVMRSEETSNARSSLGYSAVDVKRFLHRFCSRERAVCRERYEGLAA